MRRFNFKIFANSEYLGEGTIEIDQSVLDQGNSDEFKKYFWTFADDEKIAAHIAWRMVVWDEKLSEIEGFMMPNELAKLVEYPHRYNDFEFIATESERK